MSNDQLVMVNKQTLIKRERHFDLFHCKKNQTNFNKRSILIEYYHSKPHIK
jgi:hypothetical protein